MPELEAAGGVGRSQEPVVAGAERPGQAAGGELRLPAEGEDPVRSVCPAVTLSETGPGQGACAQGTAATRLSVSL